MSTTNSRMRSVMVAMILSPLAFAPTATASAGEGSLNIKLGIEVAAMSVIPNGQFAYLVAPNASRLAVVNLASRRVSTIPIHSGANITDVAVTPNGEEIYVTSDGSSGVGYERTLYVLNAKTERVVRTVDVGGSSSLVAFSPNGQYAYVAVGDSAFKTGEALKTIAVGTQKIVRVFSIAPGPSIIAISPNSKVVYIASDAVSSSGGNTPSALRAVNAVSGKVDRSILGPHDSEACGLALNSSGTLIYQSFCDGVGVGSSESGIPAVQVIDTATFTVTGNVEIPGGVRGLALSKNGRLLYAAADTTYGVDEIGTKTRSIVGQFPEDLDSPLSAVNLLNMSSNGQFIYGATFNIAGDSQFLEIALAPVKTAT